MYPPEFNYLLPATLQEAIELLSKHKEQEAKILAGGQSLIPLLKFRMTRPEYLIDISRLEELSGIEEKDGFVLFGALARHGQIEASELVRASLPIMYDAASQIGDVQIRSLGTIGGSLAHADPAGDWAPVLVALDATLGIQGPQGERTVKIQDLLIDAYECGLAGDELLTEIRAPVPPPGSGGAYLKLEKKAGDFAVVSLAIQLTLDEKEACREIGVGLGAVGSTAIRATQAEEALRGHEITSELLEEAASRAAGQADPFSDSRGTADYKRQMVKVLFGRAFDVARRRAKGEQVETVHL